MGGGPKQLHLPCSGMAHQKQRAAGTSEQTPVPGSLSVNPVSTGGSSDPICSSTTCSGCQISILARQCNLLYGMLSTQPPPLLLSLHNQHVVAHPSVHRESLINYQHPLCQRSPREGHQGELALWSLEEREAFAEGTLSTALNSMARAVFI